MNCWRVISPSAFSRTNRSQRVHSSPQDGVHRKPSSSASALFPGALMGSEKVTKGRAKLAKPFLNNSTCKKIEEEASLSKYFVKCTLLAGHWCTWKLAKRFSMHSSPWWCTWKLANISSLYSSLYIVMYMKIGKKIQYSLITICSDVHENWQISSVC